MSKSIVHPSLVLNVEVKQGDIPAEIIAVLERLGPATIRTLARETRHGYQTILEHLERLRKEGRVVATIPENLPVYRISPGRVVWLLVPPNKIENGPRGEGKMLDDSEWEPF